MHASATLEVQHRPDLDILVVRCLDVLEPELFQQDYRTIITEARAGNTGHWLVDMRRCPPPPPALLEWATTVWLPEVVAELAPRRPRLAYLISPSHQQDLLANSLLQASMQVAANPELGYDIAYFTDEGTATSWLQGK